MARLDEELDQARQDGGALAGVAGAAFAENARLQASLASRADETARQVAELEAALAECAHLQASLASCAHEAARQVDGLKAALAAADNALAEAAMQRDLLRASVTWRATRPVRRLAEALPGWARAAVRRALSARPARVQG